MSKEAKVDFKLGTPDEVYWTNELKAIEKNIDMGHKALEVNAVLLEFFKKKVAESK